MSRLPLLALLAACGGGAAGPDAGPPDANPFCAAATTHSDLPWIQANIFTPSCSRFSACHQGRATMAGGLNLEDGMSWSNLVNVDSKLYGPSGSVMQSDWVRVFPGDPTKSYLMVILDGTGGPIDPKTGTMPYNSPLLCQEMRDAIRRWIANGAPQTGDGVDAGVPDAAP